MTEMTVRDYVEMLRGENCDWVSVNDREFYADDYEEALEEFTDFLDKPVKEEFWTHREEDYWGNLLFPGVELKI